MNDYLPWLLLAASSLGFVLAWRTLAADAREGLYVTMGGQMMYSHTWYLSAFLGAAGLATLPGVAWWWGLVLFVALVVLQWPVSRVVIALNLGRDAPPPPKDGFREFIRKTQKKDVDGNG
jgi:hypothetical protein